MGFNLNRGFASAETPSPYSLSEEKIMFYFGSVAPDYGLDRARNNRYKARLVDTIHICSQLNRIQLMQRPRDAANGGIEKIKKTQIKKPLPDTVTPDVEDVYSMRFSQEHRLIGIMQRNVFIVLFVDYKLELYDH